MTVWINQAQKSSTTARTCERTAYLAPLRPRIEAALRTYFASNPSGTQATLAVLQALGRGTLDRFVQTSSRSQDTVKTDFGLFTIIVLVEMAGEKNVETLRQESTHRNSTRTRSSRWASLTWVSRYTPHRLTNDGIKKLTATDGEQRPDGQEGNR